MSTGGYMQLMNHEILPLKLIRYMLIKLNLNKLKRLMENHRRVLNKRKA